MAVCLKWGHKKNLKNVCKADKPAPRIEINPVKILIELSGLPFKLENIAVPTIVLMSVAGAPRKICLWFAILAAR